MSLPFFFIDNDNDIETTAILSLIVLHKGSDKFFKLFTLIQIQAQGLSNNILFVDFSEFRDELCFSKLVHIFGTPCTL